MNQRQIRIVLAVAKHLSFSQAAWETSYAASVVSKQVAALEKELGVRLFERKARAKVELTETGRALLPHLNNIQSEYDAVDRLMETMNGQKVLTVVCPRAFTTLGEDELISVFCSRYRDVEVRQTEGSQTACIDLLESGSADFSIRLLSDAQLEAMRTAKKRLGFLPLAKNRVGVLLRSDHPAIRNGHVALKDLSDELFLLRYVENGTDGDTMIALFREACRSEGFEPRLRFRSGMRRTAVFSLVSDGYCAIPVMYAPKYQYPGTSFLQFTKDYYSFHVPLLYRKDDPSPTARNFLRCAAENRRIFSDMYFAGQEPTADIAEKE